MIKKESAKPIYSYLKNQITNLYTTFGFEELTLEVLVKGNIYAKYKGVDEKNQIRFIDKKGEVIVLRPDATFQVLKHIENLNKKEAERYFYNTKIFRYSDKEKKDVEINQTGVELFSLGESTYIWDGEVIALAIKSLLSLGFKDIRLDLGHADFIYALLEEIENIDKNDIDILHNLIEEKNSVELLSYLSEKNVDDNYKNKLNDICMMFGDFDEVIKIARNICINEKMTNALDNLEDIYKVIKMYNLESYVYLDLGFANPMNYYSGMIFRTYVPYASEAVISGGRYDRLSKKFGKRKNACGFGLNIDIAIEALNHMDIALPNKKGCEIRVNAKMVEKGIETAIVLRNMGFNAFVSINGNEKMEIYDYYKKRTVDLATLLKGTKND